MTMHGRLAAVAWLVLLAWMAAGAAKSRRWDPALGPDPAPEYEVTVDGRKVDLLAVQMIFAEAGAQPVPDWGGVYWAASFPYRPGAEIRVRSLTASLRDVQFLPKGRIGHVSTHGDKEISFSSDRPFRVALEREGRIKPLLLFANAEETDLPDFDNPNVIRFKPGVHEIGKLELSDNQTLYLDYGAILYGGVLAQGTNITIRGHGVISGAHAPRFKGPCGHVLSGRKCRGLKIRDVTVTAPWSWTFTLFGCDGVKVDGVRVLASRMINDDAIDVVNSRNVFIRNSFIRAQDDIIAIKGCDAGERLPVERVLVEDCDMWCDRANVFRIGYECDAAYMGKIAARNLEILHVTSEYEPWKGEWPHAVFWLQPSGGMPMGNLHFENVHVNLDGYDTHLVIANPRIVRFGDPPYSCGGSVSNVVFRNITADGDRKGRCLTVLAGRSPSENVRNVKFENVRVFGKALSERAPDVEIGDFASEVTFVP